MTVFLWIEIWLLCWLLFIYRHTLIRWRAVDVVVVVFFGGGGGDVGFET